jgi:polyhydroxyalkanoate synthase
MKTRGYLEGSHMANAFNMLRPNDLIWPYVQKVYMKGQAPLPFDLLYWNSDATRMPCANHSFYLRNCYLENKLAKGEMEIDGIELDLKEVKIPIFNLATREDHIAPARSVFYGSRLFGGPVEFVLAGSGHIAGVVNPPSKPKYQYWTDGPPEGDLETWLAKAEEHPGTWWPYWFQWLERQAPERVKARKPGSGKLKPLGDAPGTYVLVKS